MEERTCFYKQRLCEAESYRFFDIETVKVQQIGSDGYIKTVSNKRW